MDRPVQPGDFVRVSRTGADPTLYAVRSVQPLHPPEIRIYPLNNQTNEPRHK